MPPLQGYRCLLGRLYPGLAPPGYSNGLPFGAFSTTLPPSLQRRIAVLQTLGHSRLSRRWSLRIRDPNYGPEYLNDRRPPKPHSQPLHSQSDRA